MFKEKQNVGFIWVDINTALACRKCVINNFELETSCSVGNMQHIVGDKRLNSTDIEIEEMCWFVHYFVSETDQ